ncbi:TetR/AcrR family transcriptional regulator [Kitasatospora sp. McL0602]|uniref:TetR/AcrR family transcriptional regulator n=1 Tax=Kitasatospora sp. McL0602 TaxID=3439530 RepID=UPI003F8AB063
MKTETTAPKAHADRDCSAGEPGAPRRGRPRSEAAEQAIFAAVERLMEEGAGLAELSVERIAAAAGVGKATIYRRWPNKEALLIDVVARLDVPEPVLCGRGVRDDLVGMMEYMRQAGLAKRSRWMLKAALGQMHSWPELRNAYEERVLRPRRELARTIIRRGVDEGVLRDDLDLDILAEIVMGPMLLRTVLWEDAPLDDPTLPERMVDAVLRGVGADPAR